MDPGPTVPLWSPPPPVNGLPLQPLQSQKTQLRSNKLFSAAQAVLQTAADIRHQDVTLSQQSQYQASVMAPVYPIHQSNPIMLVPLTCQPPTSTVLFPANQHTVVTNIWPQQLSYQSLHNPAAPPPAVYQPPPIAAQPVYQLQMSQPSHPPQPVLQPQRLVAGLGLSEPR